MSCSTRQSARRSPERGQYAFVQMMFRQVAYDTLSRRERKARHLIVAAHLQTAFADGGEMSKRVWRVGRRVWRRPHEW